MNRRGFLKGLAAAFTASVVKLPLPAGVTEASPLVEAATTAPVVHAGMLDIRQILIDNMLRDIQAEEDDAFIRSVNTQSEPSERAMIARPDEHEFVHVPEGWLERDYQVPLRKIVTPEYGIKGITKPYA